MEFKIGSVEVGYLVCHSIGLKIVVWEAYYVGSKTIGNTRIPILGFLEDVDRLTEVEEESLSGFSIIFRRPRFARL